MQELKIPENRIYNAYLIQGEDSGVTLEAALQFSAALLKRDEEQRIWRNRGYTTVEDWRESVDKRIRNLEHPDLILIKPDKPEENPRTVSVDNIRRNIADTVEMRPYEAAYKVYMIQNAEKMNIQAQNALLKTLEEPPEYVVIMLLAQNADSFLETILSRVIEIHTGERDTENVVRELMQSDWAKRLLRLLSEIHLRSAREILECSRELSSDEVGAEGIFSFLEIILRDVLCYKSTGSRELLYAQGAEETVVSLAREMSYRQLGDITDRLEKAIRGQKFNVNAELQMEDLFLHMRRK